MHDDYGHLSRALDPGRMKSFFEHRLSQSREIVGSFDLFIPRVFPREDDTFAIQYVLRELPRRGKSAQNLILWGHLVGPGRNMPGYVNRPEAEVMVDSDLGLVVPMFPYDPELPSLQALCDPHTQTDFLIEAGLLDAKIEMPASAAHHELLAYRLERRCVVRFDLLTGGLPGHRRIVVRAIRPKKFDRVNRAMSGLADCGFNSDSSDGLAIPALLATDAVNGLFFVEHVDGMSLHDMTGFADFHSGCRSAAGMLKRLHGLTVRALPSYTCDDELKALRERLSQVGRIFPSLEHDFEQSYERVEQGRSSILTDHRATCIHRDFYDKQVLWSPERATLLDCDTLAFGDPALDYGNFLAHLLLRSLQAPELTETVALGRAVFQSEIDEMDSALKVRVDWWQKTSLVRLAALYSLRPRWRHLAGSLLNLVINDLQGTVSKLA